MLPLFKISNFFSPLYHSLFQTYFLFCQIRLLPPSTNISFCRSPSLPLFIFDSLPLWPRRGSTLLFCDCWCLAQAEQRIDVWKPCDYSPPGSGSWFWFLVRGSGPGVEARTRQPPLCLSSRFPGESLLSGVERISLCGSSAGRHCKKAAPPLHHQEVAGQAAWLAQPCLSNQGFSGGGGGSLSGCQSTLLVNRLQVRIPPCSVHNFG